MKKVLLCASVLILAASCSEKEFDTVPGQETTRGIYFETGEPTTTRGEFDYDPIDGYSWKWYAEKDFIKIWAPKNIASVLDREWGAVTDAEAAEYKATRSESRGLFTARTDGDILDFEEQDEETEFLIVYPSSVELEAVTVVGGSGSDKDKIATVQLKALPGLTNQTVKDFDNNPFAKQLKYDYVTAQQDEWYESVGDKVVLSLKNAFTLARFNIVNLDDYSNAKTGAIFGKLQSIDFNMLGAAAENALPLISPSYIDYGSVANYLIDFTDRSKSKFIKADGTDITDWSSLTGAEAEIKLTVDQPWGDEDYAFMTINNVDRSEFRAAGRVEKFEIVYTFENIVFKDTLQSSINWPSAVGATVPVTSLDINKYDYLVVGASNARTLIFNKGALNDIFEDPTATNKAVKWSAEASGTVAATAFVNIYVNKDLTDAEVVTLSKAFSNAEVIRMDEEDNIPNGAAFPNTLETLSMKKVTGIALGAFKDTQMSTVILPAYGFVDDAINQQILNKTSLVTLDMSAVTQMAINWPTTGFTLADYDKLQEVTVMTGVRLGTKAFSDCTSLHTVNGAVELVGTGVFEGCLGVKADGSTVLDGNALVDGDKPFSSVKLTTNIITDNAFAGCTYLTEVLENTPSKSLVVPTYVGASAFEDCTSLDVMNLKDVTYLGESAFAGCTSLYGILDNSYNPAKEILTVGAESISASAFAGCTSLVHVYFTNATSFGDMMLSGAGMVQVRFDQVFSLSTTSKYDDTTFGSDPTAVTLFVNDNQTGYIGPRLTIGTGSNANSYIFSGINKVSTIQ